MATRNAKGQSLPELMAQIAQLQAEAERVKTKEKADVIARIKEAIEVYDIAPGELFGTDGKARGRKAAKAAVVKKVRAKPGRRARRFFTDEDKQRIVNEHAALRRDGLTWAEASKKVDVSDPLLRSWYLRFKPTLAAKSQRTKRAATKKAKPARRAKPVAPTPAQPEAATGT